VHDLLLQIEIDYIILPESPLFMGQTVRKHVHARFVSLLIPILGLYFLCPFLTDYIRIIKIPDFIVICRPSPMPESGAIPAH
jgi:hypothetical protein